MNPNDKSGDERKLSESQRQSLVEDYRYIAPIAQRAAAALEHQLNSLLTQNNIRAEFPVVHRIKTWDSIEEKLQRKSLQISTCKDIADLVGLRIILLFNDDVERTCKLIEQNFTILERDDKMEKLKEDTFGYRSTDFRVTLSEKWRLIPTLSEGKEFRFDIQVRTLAQHIWAAASHRLQYKQEAHVPAPIKRSINRVAALLEVVDLEFERVLCERDTYREQQPIVEETLPETLNTDSVAKLLDEMLPPQNKSDNEHYARLIDDMHAFKMDSLAQLRALWNKYKVEVLEEDRQRVVSEKAAQQPTTAQDRLDRGVYFGHVGLARRALGRALGPEFRSHLIRTTQSRALQNLS